MKRIIKIILLIIAIISLLISCQIFMSGKKYIEVNSANKDVIYKMLEGEINDINEVKMVAVGQGINNNRLYIYYSYGEIDIVKITEGAFNTELPIDSYIRENGREKKYPAIILSIVSIIMIVIVIANDNKHFQKKLIGSRR